MLRRIRITDDASLKSAVVESSGTARSHGFDSYHASTIGTVTSELARNILKYAGTGEILIRVHKDPHRIGVEITAQDKGPGIEDVDRALADHYSSSGTLGLGLPGVRRLVDEFEIESQPGDGCRVKVTKWIPVKKRTLGVQAGQAEEHQQSTHMAPGGVRKASGEVAGGFSWASYSRPKSGEQVCGDGTLVRLVNGHLLLVILDGLGHGPAAFKASSVALALLERVEPKAPTKSLTDLHEKMKGTVGAACAIAMLDLETLDLRYAGIGNTSGRIFHIDAKAGRSLVGANGTLGQRMRSPVEISEAIRVGDLLVFHTDGVESRFGTEDYPQLRIEIPTVVAKTLVTRYGRPYDDATALVLRANGGRTELEDG